ncbi:hypothetical protein TVAG_386140 [Trichomonas vaginalis G3]|uniref:Uncharacterized protein n=1 Tax=Trichomonas vaginalis (strain ATCC PRA-98 / G3) TaxID=412133 RepID=A2FSD1_TRIV3|nr:amelogenin-related protein family [Trichomonas vaginalis G3]EAX92190.1 hypothetical protein TVAG_386140 [Trichomonas vaginalis G3]KAI5488464.1 amelogenin-related protein family [Trichomonas vaginalis G3]|eukprot:XP_001305120.1 hypothetical protein [Trichomonas vaginalis G3]
MFLNLLPFIHLDLGRNDYLINGTTTFKLPKSYHVGILPNETEGFTFEDSENNTYTDFPIILTIGTHLIITPSQETGAKKISIIAAPIYKECDERRFILDGFMKTDETVGYYKEPNCYIFMNPKFDNISVQVISNTPIGRLKYGTGENPIAREYYDPIIGSSATLMIQDYADSFVQMTMIDSNIFDVGDFEISFKDEYEFHIPPNSVFVAHTIKDYIFESDKEPIADGVFFDKDSRYSVKAKKPGKNTIVGSISVISPYVPCTELNVEIVRSETSTIFGAIDSDYTIDEDSTFCHIFTSPVPRRYKFVIQGQYNLAYISNPYSTDENDFSDYRGFPYINKSAIYYLTVSHDLNIKSGLETTNIVTPYHDFPDCRDGETLKIYGNIPRNPKPAKPFKLPDGLRNVNYLTGRYQINIPSEGANITFQMNSIVIFHNAHSFKGTLGQDPVLHDTGNYVFNFTDMINYFKIKPVKNQSLIANISVLVYKIKGCPPATTNDVIVVSPNHPVSFTVSPESQFGSNLTYDKRQSVKFNVFASSAFYYTVDSDTIYNCSEYWWYGTNFEGHDYRISEFRTVTTIDPETEEIYGLFRGALSYTDLKKSHFNGYRTPKVYTYGNEYYPPDNYYNYPKFEISAVFIIGITIPIIIAIVVAAFLIVVCIRRRRKSYANVTYTETNYMNENEAAQEQIYVKYGEDDSEQKVDRPASTKAQAKTPSLETPLNPIAQPPPVYIIIQPGQPGPAPNPYT